MTLLPPTVYAGFYRLFARDGGRCLSVLTYHRVLPEFDPMRPGEPHGALFRTQMERIRRYYTPVALADALGKLRNGDSLPPRAVAVTFDDGYADNLCVAAPILGELGIPATVFVASAFLDGGRMWNDTVVETLRCRAPGAWDLSALDLGVLEIESPAQRRQVAYRIISAIKHRNPADRQAVVDRLADGMDQLPDDLMLSTQQLKSLRASGVEIGSHTVSHPILRSLDPAAAREEIEAGKRQLQDILEEEVALFAYPNGKFGRDWDDSHAAMVRDAGFAAAVTTEPGVSSNDTDQFRVPRFTPWDRTDMRYLLRMLKNARR